MRIVLASALTVLGLTVAACSSGPDTKAATKKYADKVCACKDAECVTKAMEEGAKSMGDMGKDYKPSEAEAKAAAEMGECAQKLMTK